MENNRKKLDGGPPDGGYGWIIVCATTLINVCLYPLVQCFGIIFKEEFSAMGVTAAETSFLLHLHSTIYCSLGLLGSPLLKKYDFRRVAFFGSSLWCLGIFLSSFVKTYVLLICTVSLLIGVGQGILLPATYVATNTYFKKRLTLAVSFSVTGASLSSIFMPQLCNKLLEYGRQTTVLVLSAISVMAILCCFLLKPIEDLKITKRDEQVLENLQDNEEPKSVNSELLNHNKNEEIYKSTTLPAEKDGFLKRVHDLFNLELLKERPYVIAIVGMAISFAAELNIILMIPFVLAELASFTRTEVALALSIQSVADILGRLAIPLAGHYCKASPIMMYAGSLITSTIGRTLIAIFYGAKTTIFACAAIIGLAKGTKAVYQSVIIPKFVSLEKLPAANGLSMLLTGLSSLIIGPIIGLIHDRTDSYTYALHVGSILSMACVILWIINYYSTKRRIIKNEMDPPEIT